MAQQPSPPASPIQQDSVSSDGQSDSQYFADDDQAEGVEYLTRGPLHEAFATPYSENPEAAPVIQKEPPAPIEEVRPDLMPEGNHVQWIAGYWDFDDEKNDFIWISGLWRDLPPNMRWVPGYWATVDVGYQRVVGFWSNSSEEEITYLPQPPESLENGPSSPAPNDDHFYIPGTWVYESDNYAWRPGFWAPQQNNWVWTPANYVWTPRGCVFRQGYWDYEPTYRGVVFTPLYYTQPVYQQPNYRYQPRFVVNTALPLLVHLFVGPQRRSYYYGNYYGANYSNRYSPWVNYGRSNNAWSYDPLYSYYRHHGNRNGQNITQWASNRYDFFEKNESRRPGNTLRDQRAMLQSNNGFGEDATIGPLSMLASHINDVATGNDDTLQFTRLTDDERTRADEQTVAQKTAARERQNFEADAAVSASALDVKGDTPNKTNESGKARGKLRLSSSNANARADVQAKVNANADAKGNADAKADVDLNASGLNKDRSDRMQSGRENSVRDAKAKMNNEPGSLGARLDNSLDTGKKGGDKKRADIVPPKADRSNTDQPNGNRPNVDRPNMNRPNMNRPNANSSNADRPNDAKANAPRANDLQGSRNPIDIQRNLDRPGGASNSDRSRNLDLPALRRRMDERSKNVPGTPGVHESKPQPIPRANQAIRNMQLEVSQPSVGGGNASPVPKSNGGNRAPGNPSGGNSKGGNGATKGVKGAIKGVKSALPKL